MKHDIKRKPAEGFHVFSRNEEYHAYVSLRIGLRPFSCGKEASVQKKCFKWWEDGDENVDWKKGRRGKSIYSKFHPLESCFVLSFIL